MDLSDKYQLLLEVISDAGFKYEIGILSEESMIVIFPLHTDLGYKFPINDSEINWNMYPENAALIPDEIKQICDDVTD